MIIGHSRQVSYLTKILERNSPCSAYLFHGEEHIGKATVAQWFAQGLLCEQARPKMPCGVCGQCAAFQKGVHPDTYFVEQNENSRDIGIDQIRVLREKIAMTPFYNSYKLVIIDGAEKMNAAGFNCFLKILEEPPPKTIFILVAHTIKTMPATILSRAEMVRFAGVKEEEIIQALDSRFTNEQKRFIARIARGKIGFALVENAESVKTAIEQEKTLLAILKAPAYKKILMLEPLIKEHGEKLENQLIGLLRDILLYKIGCRAKITHQYLLKEFHNAAARYSWLTLTSTLNAILRMAEERALNLNQQFVWINLFLKL